jgi:RNase P subunit RPR2
MVYKEKICNGCGKLKQPEEYSKCRSRKDGLQPKCKECNSKDNRKFRTQIQPDYYSYETG